MELHVNGGKKRLVSSWRVDAEGSWSGAEEVCLGYVVNGQLRRLLETRARPWHGFPSCQIHNSI